MEASVLVFSTSAARDSKSRVAAKLLVKCLQERGVRTEFADVCDLPAVWVSGEGVAAAGDRWAETARMAQRADAVVFAAPIYCCTVGSPARVVVELLSGNLAGKPIGLIVAAGSMRSALAHRDFLNSLSDEVNAQILPKTVLLTCADVDKLEEVSPEIQQRVAGLADVVIDPVRARKGKMMQGMAG